MSTFSRKTLLAATDCLIRLMTHAEIDRFLLEHSLENVSLVGTSKQARVNELAQYLLAVPERVNEDGYNLIDAVVEDIVRRVVESISLLDNRSLEEVSEERFSSLMRALHRDGFTIKGGTLVRTLPESLDLPQTDDEVHALLADYGFSTAMGHLDQGIDAHARGNWASANSQFRSFIESLFDEITEDLAAEREDLPTRGQGRRQWLASLNPPFFFSQLNEWTGDGRGFLEVFYRRLHPQGSHPGLSDEEDSTFRLHLVLLVARLLLRRVKHRRIP